MIAGKQVRSHKVVSDINAFDRTSGDESFSATSRACLVRSEGCPRSRDAAQPLALGPPFSNKSRSAFSPYTSLIFWVARRAVSKSSLSAMRASVGWSSGNGGDGAHPTNASTVTSPIMQPVQMVLTTATSFQFLFGSPGRDRAREIADSTTKTDPEPDHAVGNLNRAEVHVVFKLRLEGCQIFAITGT